MTEELKNIFEKATKLYSKYGIKSVTMDDIASEIGISKKTLYQYFKDKKDLITKIIESVRNKRQKIFNEISLKKANAIEQLFMFNNYVQDMLKQHSPAFEYDLKKYHPDLYKRINGIKKERMYGYMLKNLQKGKKEGLYREDINEEIIAKLFLSRITSITENDIFSHNEYTSSPFLQELMVYHIRGIANDKGIEILNHNIKNLKSVNTNK